MKIGIDISQTAYAGTGVANYLRRLVLNLIKIDQKNDYMLFYSSLRKELDNSFIKELKSSRVKIKKFRFPPTLLDLLWNRLHILPIEWLIGPIDIFVTSDWTEPPTVRAKKATVLYDLIVYKHPVEMDKKIVATQRRKLAWVKKESSAILCISESTKKDARQILGVNPAKLRVIYPGGIC
jgi:glycosyltransferase involved in cell wall biosynthesis